jgi:hypothetical protein
MKIIYIILIISLISFSNCDTTAKIASDLKKKSLATTDSITVTITNGESAAITGAVTGLSLTPESGDDVALECGTLASTAKDASGTVTCSPKTAISTAGKYSLKATTAKVGNDVTLTVDDGSKTLTIDPNYTEESGNTNKDGAGNFHKFSSFLLIGAGLVL